MAADVRRLLGARSLAFVGGKRARMAAEQTQGFGFTGPMWIVNPAGPHRRLANLPQVPDAVFVAVPAAAAPAVVAEAAALGVGSVVVYPAGFAEAGEAGASLQADLVAAAGTMTLIGPNCHGWVDARSGAVLWPDVHGLRRVDRGVGIVSQSGNVAIDLTMQRRGLPIATVISVGNQAATSAFDCVAALVDDPAITAVGVHLEGLGDTRSLPELARRAEDADTPIVVLKTGTSERGATIAGSHTASLAGPEAAQAALFARLGMCTVDSPEGMLGALSVLHARGISRSPHKVVALSCSGGEAALMADMGAKAGLDFPPFSPAAAERLDATLEGRVALHNPLDYHTFIWGDEARLAACFTAALGDGATTGVLTIDFPASPDQFDDWWPTLRAFERAVDTTGVIGIVTSTLPENLPPAVCERVTAAGLAPIPGMATAVQVVAALDAVGPPGTAPAAAPVPTSPARIGEPEALAQLAAVGLPVPDFRETTPAAAGAAAEDVGYPVVVKAVGPEHRTELGGVALGLKTEEEVVRAALDMARLTNRLIVERHIGDVTAELLLSVRPEQHVGWAVTVGAGGILAELLDDTVTLLAPATPPELRSAVASLRIGKLLMGYRAAGVDSEPTIEVIGRLIDFAVDTGTAIEVNPLLITPTGPWIVDVLAERLETL